MQVTGIRQVSKNSWHYRVMIGKTLYCKSGFVCPAIALSRKITVMNKHDLLSYVCVSCKGTFRVAPEKRATKKPQRCPECGKKRKQQLITEYRKRNRVKPVVKIKLDIKKRMCLKCDKNFESLSCYNRVCPDCKASGDCERQTYKVIFGGGRRE